MTKKVAILLQRSFRNHFEPQALVEAYAQHGFTATLFPIEEVYATFDQTGDKFAHPKYGDIANYDVLLVREVFSYFKYALNIISYAKEKNLTVIDNNLLQEKMMINKIVDGQRLVQAGLPFPKTIHAHTLDNYRNLIPMLEKMFGFPALVKHRSSGKGRNIFKVNDRLDLENLLMDLNEDKKLGRYYIQEFLHLKTDYRILYVADKVVGVMQRIPKKGEFRANFSLGGSVRPAELTDEILDLATRAAKATNCNFAGVDIVYTTDNKPYLLEVNRTPGFEGFTQAHHINVAELFVQYTEQLLAQKTN